MPKFVRLKAGLRTRVIALSLGVVALIIAAVLLSNIRFSGESNPLTEAIEGGESLLVAIGRSHESLISFMKGGEESAGELLKAAKESQQFAEAKLTSAERTNDKFVLKMTENYGILLNSSHVMTQGIDNLLAVSEELGNTLDFYRQGAYADAAEEASVCLQTLNPLVDEFELRNQSLDGVNYQYVAADHKYQVKNAIGEYQNGTGIYLGYVSLLESILKGADYLKEMDDISEQYDQLQHALASKDYEKAEELLQEISEKLQPLKEPQYQEAANEASELDPKSLEGDAYNVAQDVKNQLKDLQGLEQFETYLNLIREFMKASTLLEQGDIEAAEEAIDVGLGLLGEGEGTGDPEMQRYHESLRTAFNSLKMRIKGQPEQG